MRYEIKPYGLELYRLLPKIYLKKKYGMFLLVPEIQRLNELDLSSLGPHKRGTQFTFPKIDQAWVEAYESIDSTAAKRRWLEDKIKQQTVIAEVCKMMFSFVS